MSNFELERETVSAAKFPGTDQNLYAGAKPIEDTLLSRYASAHAEQVE